MKNVIESNVQSMTSNPKHSRSKLGKILTYIAPFAEEDIVITQVLFIKLFTIIYIVAFSSIYVQIPGLFGKDGLLPVNNSLDKIESHYGPNKYNVLPTIFWLSKEVNKYMIQVFPSVKSFQAEENVFHFVCLINILIAFLVLFDKQCKLFMKFWVFFTLWLSYLSIFLVGDTFLSYEWDVLILETGFLVMFLVPNVKDGSLFTDHISLVSRELLRWLIFRFTFTNGLLKFLNSDQFSWSLLSLENYFEMQPLPSPLSRTFYFLSPLLQQTGVSYAFICDIILPFLLYFPIRSIRILSALSQIPLQLILMLTGNHCWLNFHLIVLLVPLLDDQFLLKYMPGWKQRLLGISKLKTSKASSREYRKSFDITDLVKGLCSLGVIAFAVSIYFPFDLLNLSRQDEIVGFMQNRFLDSYLIKATIGLAIFTAVIRLVWYNLRPDTTRASKTAKAVKATFALTFFLFIFSASLYPFSQDIGFIVPSTQIQRYYTKPIYNQVENYHIVNSFRLFKGHTGSKERIEMIIQGSNDGQSWLNYEYLYKIANPQQRSTFQICHQPRLDWQMYIALLDDINRQPWLLNLIGRLFSNSKSIMRLLKHNPFEDSPPNYIRIIQQQYTFEPKDSLNEWKFLNGTQKEYLSPVQRNDTLLAKVLKDTGFEPITKQSKYPLHVWQEIPLQSIVLTTFIIIILWNLIL